MKKIKYSVDEFSASCEKERVESMYLSNLPGLNKKLNIVRREHFSDGWDSSAPYNSYLQFFLGDREVFFYNKEDLQNLGFINLLENAEKAPVADFKKLIDYVAKSSVKFDDRTKELAMIMLNPNDNGFVEEEKIKGICFLNKLKNCFNSLTR